MAENGKSGRSAADRRRRSLTARTVRATLGSCVLLGLVALIIGLGFYTAGLTRQYIRHAFDIATYAQMSAGYGADSRGLAKQVMDIHGGLSEEDRQKVGTELSLATRIQVSMLPHEFPPFPDRKEFGIYAVMDPAREVGGGFYDFFLIDEDHLGMVMADVSGKGVPAALFMMAAKIILQSCAMLGRSASEILTKTNEAICSNNQAVMFVTVWIGILEISTGHLTAANAGYEYPAVRRAGGDRQREPALRLGAHARGAERSARRRAGGRAEKYAPGGGRLRGRRGAVRRPDHAVHGIQGTAARGILTDREAFAEEFRLYTGKGHVVYYCIATESRKGDTGAPAADRSAGRAEGRLEP